MVSRRRPLRPRIASGWPRWVNGSSRRHPDRGSGPSLGPEHGVAEGAGRGGRRRSAGPSRTSPWSEEIVSNRQPYSVEPADLDPLVSFVIIDYAT